MSKPPYKTLYLLHGILGHQNDWLVGTGIEKLAKEYGIAVIMPSGENHFYVDTNVPGQLYSAFIGEELVEITRAMFPLSNKREETFIAGLSMGGYGALHNGLKYAKTFGYIGAFSSALVLEEAVNSEEASSMPFKNRRYYQSVFGDLYQLLQSDKNPEVLINRLKKENQLLLNIFLTCGTEDLLLPKNNKFAELLKNLDIQYDYLEFTGGHDWIFWNESIHKFFDWLQLTNDHKGINSGNVGI